MEGWRDVKIRLYFTEFSEEKYQGIKEHLAKQYGERLVEHKARLLKEFRYLEILNASEKDAEAIRNILVQRGIKAKIDIIPL